MTERNPKRRPSRGKKRRSRGAVVSVRFERDVLAELDTYVADRQEAAGDRRFKRASAVRELVLLALGLADRSAPDRS